MYRKINKNRFGVIEYSIDKEEDLDDIKIDNVDNTIYAIMNNNGKELIYLYSSYAKKWILINDVQEEINSISEQLDNYVHQTRLNSVVDFTKELLPNITLKAKSPQYGEIYNKMKYSEDWDSSWLPTGYADLEDTIIIDGIKLTKISTNNF